jgi:hypothetical protein
MGICPTGASATIPSFQTVTDRIYRQIIVIFIEEHAFVVPLPVSWVADQHRERRRGACHDGCEVAISPFTSSTGICPSRDDRLRSPVWAPIRLADMALRVGDEWGRSGIR